MSPPYTLAAFNLLLALGACNAEVIRGDGPGGVGTTDGSSALQLWFQADDLGLADGLPVGHWEDASGSGNHGLQNTSTLQPVVRENARNGLPAVRFDQDFFESVTLRSRAGNLTIVAVINPDHLGASHSIIDDADSNAPMLWIDPQNRYELNSGPAAASELSAQGDDGWDLLFAITKSPGPSELYLNNATPTGTAPGSLSNPATESYDLFNRNGGQAFQGEVAELIVYDTALTNDEISAIGWYLQQKYTLNLNFLPADPVFEGYETSPAVYLAGRAIASNLPIVIGGNASGFTVSPPLPPGLELNPSSGEITGTPQDPSPETEFTVTASFPSDDDFAAALKITVIAQSTLAAYSNSPATYFLGVPIDPNLPEVMGSPPSGFSIAPDLPPGLSFDPVTGIITGTPTAAAPSAEYTVTATFPDEPDAIFVLHLGVLDEPATVLISEFMASNDRTLDDGDGQSSDWIEIHNFGSEAINLDGWFLTDRADNLNKWRFPSVELAAGGHLLVFASNQSADDYVDARGNLHTNFSLSAAGEFLGLVRPDGTTIVYAYAPAFPPQLTDISYGLAADQTTIGYFTGATPRASNPASPSESGPLISEVTDSPQPIPADSEDLVVTARVDALTHPIDFVTLRYRAMFGSEVRVPMTDLGGGLFAGTIPASRFGPGDMVRWRVTAADTSGQSRREPPFLSRTDSPEYFGTVIEDPAASSPMQKFWWFVQTPGAANTRSGTRSSIYFNGTFYDNVFTRIRGASSVSWAKKAYKFEFNRGHHLRYDDAKPRVDEINLNTTQQDKSYIREVLTYETYQAAGVAASDALPVRVEQNAAFFSIAAMVQQVDSDFLEARGLDPNGALYKMQNGITTLSGAEKKTRRDEGTSDLQRLINGLAVGSVRRDRYLFDSVDLPSAINYFTCAIISQDFDRFAKNFYLYRDSDGTGEWTQLPWDKDLTFGERFVSDDISGAGFSDEPPNAPNSRAHPFWCASGHERFGINMMVDAVIDNPVAREMYLRRLRTLMDELLQPPGTPGPQLKFEARLDDLLLELEADARKDLGKWGSSIIPNQPARQTIAEAITILKRNYLGERRRYLYRTHAAAMQGGDGLGSTLVSGDPGVTTARYHVPGDDNLGLDWTTPNFDDGAWPAGPTGLGFETTPGTFAPLIKTSVSPADVHPGSTSIFLRIPFEVTDLETIDALRLLMKYDDGFVAYLNGTEIARKNVGGTAGTLLSFDHEAGRRSDTQAVEFEELDVAAFRNALVEGQNILAIQVVNNTPTNSDLLLLPELIEVPAPASPTSVGIPGPQPATVLLAIGIIESNPPSGNQADEYFEITNPNSFAVDVSGWTVEGAVEHTFKPGTVIPSRGTGVPLHLSPDVKAFRARTTSPKGNEEHFVQGNYRGQLSARGETITIRNQNGDIKASTTYPGAPGDLQQFLRITELHYHPADPSAAEIAAGFDNDGFFEFIELKNIGPETLDLSGARFVAGIHFVFPPNTILDSGEHLLVVAHQAAFAMRYGHVPPSTIAGEYTGRLDNDGELIQLHDSVGENILKFTYNDRWFPATDDAGYALVILDDSAPWDQWDLATSWGIGEPRHGSPGVQNGTVVLQQFEGWLNSHFSPLEIDDPLLTDPDADPDLDLRSNFNEYVFGTNPRVFDPAAAGLLATARVGSFLDLTFRHRGPALDFIVTLETSANLVDWTASDLELLDFSRDRGFATLTWRLPLPADPAAHPLFARIRATKTTFRP